MKLKDFLVQLENDEQLLARYRQDRRGVAREKGLNPSQTEALASGNLKKIRKELEEDEPGTAFVFVVM